MEDDLKLQTGEEEVGIYVKDELPVVWFDLCTDVAPAVQLMPVGEETEEKATGIERQALETTLREEMYPSRSARWGHNLRDP